MCGKILVGCLGGISVKKRINNRINALRGSIICTLQRDAYTVNLHDDENKLSTTIVNILKVVIIYQANTAQRIRQNNSIHRNCTQILWHLFEGVQRIVLEIQRKFSVIITADFVTEYFLLCSRYEVIRMEGESRGILGSVSHYIETISDPRQLLIGNKSLRQLCRFEILLIFFKRRKTLHRIIVNNNIVIRRICCRILGRCSSRIIPRQRIAGYKAKQ